MTEYNPRWPLHSKYGEFVDVWCFDVWGWDGRADLIPGLIWLPAFELGLHGAGGYRPDKGHQWWTPAVEVS